MLEKLELKALLDVTQKQIELVNWYWNLYIVTIAVVVGWIVTRSKEDGPIDRNVSKWIFWGFIAFATGDLIICVHTTAILGLFFEELARRANSLKSNSLHVPVVLGWFSFRWYVGFGAIIHLVGDLIMGFILFRVWQNKAVVTGTNRQNSH